MTYLLKTSAFDDTATYGELSGWDKPHAREFQPAALELRCFTELEDLKSLEAGWGRLEAKTNDQMSYFQSFDWCYRWCEAFLRDSESRGASTLQVFAGFRGNDLVVLWPMMRVSDQFGLKRLVFIGEPLSQYANILVDYEIVSTQDLDACWAQITRNSNVDVVALNNVPANTLLGQWCVGRKPESVKMQSSVMDLSSFETYDDLLATLSTTTRKYRRKRRSKLSKLGDLSFESVSGGTKQYRDLVDLALDWKKVWLQETGREAQVLCDARARNFLKSLSKDVVVLVLRVDDKPIALEVGFMRGKHFYSYLGAFDWELSSYSPGKVQLEEALKWSIDNGLQAYDLLGNPSTYKTSWSNFDLDLRSCMSAHSFKGYVFANVWFPYVRPALKQFFYGFSGNVRQQILKIKAVFKS